MNATCGTSAVFAEAGKGRLKGLQVRFGVLRNRVFVWPADAAPNLSTLQPTRNQSSIQLSKHGETLMPQKLLPTPKASKEPQSPISTSS